MTDYDLIYVLSLNEFNPELFKNNVFQTDKVACKLAI